jgi:hypothetical protein
MIDSNSTWGSPTFSHPAIVQAIVQGTMRLKNRRG